jgi:uncharacterized C2H2 Zn-finger protein
MLYCYCGHRLVFDGVRDFEMLFRCPTCGKVFVIRQYTLEEVK